VVNIGNAALLGLACAEAFNIVTTLAAAGNVVITRAFLATYIGLFAAMLLLFETRVHYTAGCIRRNFGFLFTFTGRACFLVL
jgi:predicted GNAT superfamily acetyltransferase